MSKKFFELHPDVYPGCTSYTRTTESGELLESWERDEETGEMVDVTEREKAKLELIAAQKALAKLNAKKEATDNVEED